MKLPSVLLSIAALSVFALPAAAEIKLLPISYTHADDVLEGYLAFDDTLVTPKKPAPGVLVCPEWWGTNEFVKDRAKKLAAQGYVALAIDMYGKGVTTEDPTVAKALSSAVMSDTAYIRARAKAAYDALTARPEVDKKHIAVVGYCMGGTVALELARSGVALEAVVVLHASQLSARGDDAAALADNNKIRGPSTVCHGLADTFVTPAELDKFHAQMKAAKVDYQFVAYAGAMHAFTNPGADLYKIPGVAYDAKADARSAELMKDALASAFGKR